MEQKTAHLLLRLPLPSSYRAAAPTCRQLGSSQRLYLRLYTQRQSHLTLKSPSPEERAQPEAQPLDVSNAQRILCALTTYIVLYRMDIMIAGAVPTRHDPASAFRYMPMAAVAEVAVVLLLVVVDAVLAFPFVVGIRARCTLCPYTTLANPNARGARFPLSAYTIRHSLGIRIAGRYLNACRACRGSTSTSACARYNLR